MLQLDRELNRQTNDGLCNVHSQRFGEGVGNAAARRKTPAYLILLPDLVLEDLDALTMACGRPLAACTHQPLDEAETSGQRGARRDEPHALAGICEASAILASSPAMTSSCCRRKNVPSLRPVAAAPSQPPPPPTFCPALALQLSRCSEDDRRPTLHHGPCGQCKRHARVRPERPAGSARVARPKP